jgi:hypothetical protein
MTDGYTVLGVNKDVADACRKVAKDRGISIKDFMSDTLLTNHEIWEAYKAGVAARGGLTDDLKQPVVEPPRVKDSYMGE